MTESTLHGLKPANTFLNNALQADDRVPVTLELLPTSYTTGRPTFQLRRTDQEHTIIFDSYFDVEWTKKWYPPDDMFVKYLLFLRPQPTTDTDLRRKIHFKVEGLDQIPNLKISNNGLFTIKLIDYFSAGSPIVLEFQRRHRIETDDKMQRVIRERLAANLALGPFQTD